MLGSGVKMVADGDDGNWWKAQFGYRGNTVEWPFDEPLKMRRSEIRTLDIFIDLTSPPPFGPKIFTQAKGEI